MFNVYILKWPVWETKLQLQKPRIGILTWNTSVSNATVFVRLWDHCVWSIHKVHSLLKFPFDPRQHYFHFKYLCYQGNWATSKVLWPLDLMTCAGGTVSAKEQPFLPPEFKLKGTSTILPRIRYLPVINEAAMFHWHQKLQLLSILYIATT